MEDPWANAWRDSSKSVLPQPSPLWASPSVSVLHGDHETDLSTPSWPKDSEASSAWVVDPSADHIWSATESAWNPQPSTLDKASLAGEYTAPVHSHNQTHEADSSSASLSLDGEHSWALPKPQLQEARQPTPPSISASLSEKLEATNAASANEDHENCSPLRSPVSQTLSPTKSPPAPLSDDIDGFGSFETGQDEQERASSHLAFPPMPPTSGPWDSDWQVESDDGNNEQEDAWEAARRQKEKQDRHVPPELLSSILRQLEEFLKDQLEDPSTADAEINQNLDFDMLGLNPVLQRISPDDMTLPPTVPFTKTFTMKHMSESLKLTRHCTTIRSSPMAMYLASKGSNAWEAAVKARPVVTDDDTPVGWKIADSSSTQEDSSADDGKKRVGGILSFFGRRSHNLSVDGSSKRSGSPMTASAVSPSKTSTPRAGSPATDQSKTVVSEPATAASQNDNKSTIPTTDAAKVEIQPEVAQHSAVSRFLDRIVGRPKPRSIDSLALSADDLEFLADVPTSSNNSGLKKDDLSTIFETRLSLPLSRSSVPPSRRESPLPKLPPPPSRSTGSEVNEDLLSLFGPIPIPTPPNKLNLPPSRPIPTPTSQSSIRHDSPPHQFWTPFEEPAIRSATDSVDLLKSSSSLTPRQSLIPTLPAPQSRQTINGSMTQQDALRGPKLSSAPVLVLPAPISPSSDKVDDDDEFSDFLSSPAVETSQSNSFSLHHLDGASIPSITMTDNHDDFGDFGEIFNNFTGPKPNSATMSVPSATPTSPMQSETARPRKTAKKADHSRTLSLLETAAAHGRWLAPPSPIPERISPPPASNSATDGLPPRKLDMQAQQARAVAASHSAKSSSVTAADSIASIWRLPPPPSGTLLTPSVTSSLPVHTPPPRSKIVAQPNSAQAGGLSAQDLSFFEGL